MNCGGRFSRNARGPSAASFDAITSMPRRPSIAKASVSGRDSVSRRVRRMAATARGPFAAMRDGDGAGVRECLPVRDHVVDEAQLLRPLRR